MMIVACPACSVRFKMDPALIPEKGRIVRCSGCSHKWRLMPSDFEKSSAPKKPAPAPERRPVSAPAEEVRKKRLAPPSSDEPERQLVRKRREPAPAEASPHARPPMPKRRPPLAPQKEARIAKERQEVIDDDDDDFDDDIETAKLKQKFTASTLLLLTFGVTILILFFVMRSYIIQFVPQTEKIYSIFGYENEMTGITLVKPFLEKTAPGKLAVQGTVLNADTQKTLQIPALKISLTDRSNFVIKEFIYKDFKNKFLSPGAEEDFIYVINLPDNAIDVRLEFVGQ